MKEKYKIVLLPGDDIGPEVIQEAIKILKVLESKLDFIFEIDSVPVGGAEYEATGHPFSEQSLNTAKKSNASVILTLPAIFECLIVYTYPWLKFSSLFNRCSKTKA